MKWCFSLQQENDIYVSRWWQLKYCENFHPGSLGKWSNLTSIFFKGCWNHQLGIVYIFIHILSYLSICICTSGGTKNNKSGWLISGITVPAVIGISIDPGESLFKSNKGFIIEISFGSKSEFPLPHFATLVYQMKFLEGERFWMSQNLTHASSSWEVLATLHPYLPYHKTRYYIIISRTQYMSRTRTGYSWKIEHEMLKHDTSQSEKDPLQWELSNMV